MSLFVGVDGGISGALAFFCPDDAALRVYPVPSMTHKARGKTRTTVDADALNTLLALEIGLEPNVVVRIESGVGDRRQSSSAAYTYGFTNGAVWMALKSRVPDTDFVHPTVWKRALGLIGTDKPASRRKAQRAFPYASHLWVLAGSHNSAEAALIALYASKAHG